MRELELKYNVSWRTVRKAVDSAPPRASTCSPRTRPTPSPGGRPPPSVRGPIQPAEAEALLRVWVDGGIDTRDAAQRQALEDLAAADMVARSDIIDRFHDNVLYSLRMLPEPSPPTDIPDVADY
jgi:hypothetical protein